ncbi:DUF1810 domain-containing protein [Sabulicella glaciei]|uniref:DUF1810 domain-containing protein n=1 Tax=Sabulicella glaciei TaxID=2984948 RepID=A0ABT3P1T2_9PROT|nr:DUF1810 domain-containing protein [Roseococcus sp. MDT2-1-1]MCW8088379.1 DUF1810 domain-containing protein [Roseococcus sp. MDT2-1-1]
MSDPFGLARFVAAQEGVLDRARAELRAGAKRSHWMWFVFPQLRRLGRSEMAHRFGIASAEEARAYLAHPVLGPRLLDCKALALASPAASALALFGPPDDMKFRSCMTLFARVRPGPSPFKEALARFFEGEPDPRTLALLDGAASPAGGRG